jgi:hypothetical protein
VDPLRFEVIVAVIILLSESSQLLSHVSLNLVDLSLGVVTLLATLDAVDEHVPLLVMVEVFSLDDPLQNFLAVLSRHLIKFFVPPFEYGIASSVASLRLLILGYLLRLFFKLLFLFSDALELPLDLWVGLDVNVVPKD